MGQCGKQRGAHIAAGAVECWLLEVEGAMKRAVHSLAKEALTAYPKGPRTSWILQWPSQLVLNCSQVGPSHYCLISKLPNTAPHQDKRTLCCGATVAQLVPNQWSDALRQDSSNHGGVCCLKVMLWCTCVCSPLFIV